MATRTRLSAAERRHSILRAAGPRFRAAGYERTRVADIAAELGVTEPVIFQNFGTKADLFSAVLDHVADGAAAQLDAMVEQSGDVPQLLRHLLSAEHLDFMHTQHVGMLFEDARRLGEDHPVFPALQRCTARVVAAFAGMLRRGQNERTIRADVPAEALAWLVMSLVHARQLRRMNVSAARLEDDLLEATLDLLTPR